MRDASLERARSGKCFVQVDRIRIPGDCGKSLNVIACDRL